MAPKKVVVLAVPAERVGSASYLKWDRADDIPGGAVCRIIGHFGVSGGFDGFQLSGKALQPNPLIQYFGDTAAVTLSGFYFGGQVKW